MSAPVPDAAAVARAVDELDEWVRDYWLGDGDERLQVADLMMKRGHLGTLLAALRSRDAAIAQAVTAEREACAKECESFVPGDAPPGWSAELFDECELKEDAYDAGASNGAWHRAKACAAAIRARRERVEGGSDAAARE